MLALTTSITAAAAPSAESPRGFARWVVMERRAASTSSSSRCKRLVSTNWMSSISKVSAPWGLPIHWPAATWAGIQSRRVSPSDIFFKQSAKAGITLSRGKRVGRSRARVESRILPS